MAATFLPLEVGNRWTYRDFESGQSFTISVGNPVEIEGRLYFPVDGYASERLLVRYNTYNNLVYRDEARGEDVLLTSFEIVPGAWFNAPFRPCEQMGQVAEQRGSYGGILGPFGGTLDITYREGCADAATLSEQYVDNIGLVTRTVTTFVGSRIYDLVYARVARGTVIDAFSRSGFNMNYVSRPGGEILDVTLRLTLEDASPITLAFSSGQEIELQIVDRAGEVVWTWSADKLFTQEAHDRLIEGAAEWSVEVPRVLPNGERLSRERHILSARLTTRGPVQFAAALPYSGY